MPTQFQFSFPPDVKVLRDQVLLAVQRATADRTLISVQQAQGLLADWLRQHPEDFAALDAGEALSMLEEALLKTGPVPALALSS